MYVLIGLTRSPPGEEERPTAFPCTSAAIPPKTNAVACGAAESSPPIIDLSVPTAGFDRFLPVHFHGAASDQSCQSSCLSSAVDLGITDRLAGLLFDANENRIADAAVEFGMGSSRSAFSCANVSETTLLYNASVPWAIPAFMALVDSCVLHNSSTAIAVSSQAFADAHPTILLNPMTSIFVSLAFAYMPSFFIATIVKEKSKTRIIHQLLVMGIDKQMLWLSYLISDGTFLLVSFLCPVWITVLIIDIPYLTGSGFLPFVMVCLSALIATLVTAYWVSGWFKEPESAVGIVLTSWMLVSDLAFSITLGLQQVAQIQPMVFPLAQFLDAVFLVFVPPYTIVSGMNALYDLSAGGPLPVDTSELLVWSRKDEQVTTPPSICVRQSRQHPRRSCSSFRAVHSSDARPPSSSLSSQPPSFGTSSLAPRNSA